MNEHNIILGAYTSEKGVRLADKHGQIVFRVAKKAKKPQIKKAVEKLFAVNVIDVQTVNISGKRKHFKQLPGKRSDCKKAYVSLASGQDINFANFQ